MGFDHFAVLQQPRRAWLDPDQLKERYQELTFAHHPDRQSSGEQTDFSGVTEAYRILSNPRLRILHLLRLETNADISGGKLSTVPDELADLFMEAAGLVQEIDAHRQKQEQTASALGKSLLQAEKTQLNSQAEKTLERLEGRYGDALQDLHRIDETWSSDHSTSISQLRALADVFGYLDRWISQLREKQFQLSS